MTNSVERLTRRQLLRASGTLASGALVYHFAPTVHARTASQAGQAAQADRAAGIAQAGKVREQIGATPIAAEKLTDAVTLLSGPGGNVIVLHGAEGKLVVDGFVQPAWPNLKKALDGLGSAPVRTLVDTHWHFDHADNNANFRAAGAAVLSSENTRKRLTESHELLGMRFEAVPPAGLPTETFKGPHKLSLNGESITLDPIAPAHTDTDAFVHLTKANVLHLGDVFFNGTYPFIDAATGGHIDGMIGGAERALKIADAQTKIVPGHGPLADKAALTKYRDVLTAIRDGVQKLKSAGRSLVEVQAAKPTAEFDAVWGKGLIPPDFFVAIVYNTLK